MYDTGKIRRLMKVHRHTHRSLAAAAGIAPGTVSRVLMTGSGTFRTVEAIAAALGVELADLLTKEDA